MNRSICALLLLLGLCTAIAADEVAPVEGAVLPTAQTALAQAGPGILFQGNPRFWSAGAAVGSSFAAPWIVGTVQGTASFLPYTIVELGCDFGFVHGYRDEGDMEYFSIYPFGHFNGYVPLGPLGGFYGGAGGGAMLAFYTLEGERKPYAVPAFDVTAGLYVGKKRHYLTAGYTLRTDFGRINSKVSLGYSYRFWEKEDSNENE
jgi:hypothetical protein